MHSKRFRKRNGSSETFRSSCVASKVQPRHQHPKIARRNTLHTKNRCASSSTPTSYDFWHSSFPKPPSRNSTWHLPFFCRNWATTCAISNCSLRFIMKRTHFKRRRNQAHDRRVPIRLRTARFTMIASINHPRAPGCLPPTKAQRPQSKSW